MPSFAVVAAPPATPARFGLLRSANTPTDPQPAADRWPEGFTWAPESCGGGGLIVTCGSGTRTLPDDEQPDLPQYRPFFAWVSEVCSTMSRRDEQDARGRATRKLDACLSKLIEAELWKGTVTQAQTPDLPNAYLADDAAVDDLGTGGATTALRDALAGLEEGLAACSCGGRGMIHATIPTVLRWDSLNLLRRDGDIISTILGTIVVPGAGYDGSAPDGTPAPADGSTAWAYGTGMVDVRLGRVEVLGGENSLVHSVNTGALIAQRPVAATFDPCCHVGLNVDLSDRS